MPFPGLLRPLTVIAGSKGGTHGSLHLPICSCLFSPILSFLQSHVIGTQFNAIIHLVKKYVWSLCREQGLELTTTRGLKDD